jgi:hypothetical protein
MKIRILQSQMAWALLAALWNVVGVARISEGKIGLGPTATLAGAAALVVAAGALWWSHRRTTWVYVLLSTICAVLALAAIYGGLTRESSFWPSEFWRWAGILLNGAGMIASIAGVWLHGPNAARSGC